WSCDVREGVIRQSLYRVSQLLKRNGLRDVPKKPFLSGNGMQKSAPADDQCLTPFFEGPARGPTQHCEETRRRAAGHCRKGRLIACLSFFVSGYGTEQPVCLAVDPVGEVQDIGAAVVDPVDPEGEGPEAASRVAARVDRDRAVKLPVARDKGIDLAMEEAEVADQHIIAEP